MATKNAEALAAVSKKYEWGFATEVEQDFAPKGLSEDTVRYISAKKNEPQWMLDWRLKAYRQWLEMTPPDWAKLSIPPIDYQDAYYYAEPKQKKTLASLATAPTSGAMPVTLMTTTTRSTLLAVSATPPAHSASRSSAVTTATLKKARSRLAWTAPSATSLPS